MNKSFDSCYTLSTLTWPNNWHKLIRKQKIIQKIFDQSSYCQSSLECWITQHSFVCLMTCFQCHWLKPNTSFLFFCPHKLLWLLPVGSKLLETSDHMGSRAKHLWHSADLSSWLISGEPPNVSSLTHFPLDPLPDVLALDISDFTLLPLP